MRDLDATILHRQAGPDYAVALVRYLLENDSNPSARLEWLYEPGGDQAAGRVHALLLDHGGNHAKNRTASAPALTVRNSINASGLAAMTRAHFSKFPDRDCERTCLRVDPESRHRRIRMSSPSIG